jgi:signal transduction histidine kinase
LALGVPNDCLPHRSENAGLLNLLLHQGASALHLEDLRRRQLQRVQATRIEASIDLARRVVHEVNNPLGIIKNYLKVLGMKMAAAGMEDRETQIISQEISRISRLLKKLTAFSTPESPGEARTDLNALLLDLLALTQAPLLSDANISIHSDLEPNLPKVVIDPDNLKQVLINLIRNAADAISPRGGRIEIRTRHLAPPLGDAPSRGANAAGGQIEVVIRDDGPGIPQAVREKLFDPYVSTKGGAHSGLGLAIVYHIIQSFHGSIVCESAPDHGTAFTIVLPAEKISTTPSGEAPR